MMKKPSTIIQRRRLERVLVSVDVKALLDQDDRRSCAAHIFNCVSNVLEKCNEHSKSSTQWRYDLFDSSRLLLASNTIIAGLLEGEAARVDFDSIPCNLDRFGKVLEALVTARDVYGPAGESTAENIVRAVLNVVLNSPWDPHLVSDSSSSDEEMNYSMRRTCGGGDPFKPEPNLVVLFSSLPRSSELTLFLNGSMGKSLTEGELLREFSSKFRHVQAAFEKKSIQFCWIDVPPKKVSWNLESHTSASEEKIEQRIVRKALSSMTWTSFPLKLLALTSDFVPFRLAWNMIACLTPSLPESRLVARREAQIVCLPPGRTRSEPAFCKVQLQLWTGPQHANGSRVESSRLSGLFSSDPALRSPSPSTSTELNLVAEEVIINLLCLLPRKNNVKLSCEHYTVRQSVSPTSFIGPIEGLPLGDKVMQHLEQFPGEFTPGEPAWQLLLFFLAREEVIAVVTVNHAGHSCEAIMEPSTPHSAILTVVEKADISLLRKRCSVRHSGKHSGDTEKDGNDSRKVPTQGLKAPINCAKDSLACGNKSANAIKSAFQQTLDVKMVRVVSNSDRSRKRLKVEEWGKNLDVGHDCYRKSSKSGPERVSWEEYWLRVGRLSREAAMHPDYEIRMSISTARDDFQIMEQSLKYLKELHVNEVLSGDFSTTDAAVACEEDGQYSTEKALESSPDQGCDVITFPRPPQVEENTKEVLEPIPQQGSELITSFDRVMTVSSFLEDGSQSKLPEAAELTPELAAAFISDLNQSILYCLSTTEEDFHYNAKKLVMDVFTNLYVLHASDVQNDASTGVEDLCERLRKSVACRLKKLLLTKPKKLQSKYKQPVAPAGTSSNSNLTSKVDKVKEHELQIFFRLEMICLDGGAAFGMEDQNSFVEEICKLLDNIHFDLGGGIFGGESLLSYCNRLITSRYKESFPNVVDRIFSGMELHGYDEPISGHAVEAHEGLSSGCPPGLSEDCAPEQEGLAETRRSGWELASSTGEARKAMDVNERSAVDDERVLQSGNHSLQENPANQISRKRAKGQKKDGAYQLAKLVRLDSNRKSTSKKDYYHFTTGAHNLRRVKSFKPREKSTRKHRKPSRLPSRPAPRITDQAKCILSVCETPMAHGRSRVPQIFSVVNEVRGSPSMCDVMERTSNAVRIHVNERDDGRESEKKRNPVVAFDADSTSFLKRRPGRSEASKLCHNKSHSGICSAHQASEEGPSTSPFKGYTELPGADPTVTCILEQSLPKGFLPVSMESRDAGVANSGAALHGVENVPVKNSGFGSLERGALPDSDDDDDDEGVMSTPLKVNSNPGSHVFFGSEVSGVSNFSKIGVEARQTFERRFTTPRPRKPRILSPPPAAVLRSPLRTVFVNNVEPYTVKAHSSPGLWNKLASTRNPPNSDGSCFDLEISPKGMGDSARGHNITPRVSSVIPRSPLGFNSAKGVPLSVLYSKPSQEVCTTKVADFVGATKLPESTLCASFACNFPSAAEGHTPVRLHPEVAVNSMNSPEALPLTENVGCGLGADKENWPIVHRKKFIELKADYETSVMRRKTRTGNSSSTEQRATWKSSTLMTRSKTRRL